MTRDDIIRMAREADMGFYYTVPTIVTELQRFAALVIAHEREKVARILIFNGFATGHGDTIEHLLDALTRQVAEREREACAKVCETLPLDEYSPSDAYAQRQLCAFAIRKRGKE